MEYKLKGTTSSIDLRKFRNKWSSKEEFEKVNAIRDRFDQMRRGRENGAFWAKVPEENTMADYEEAGGETTYVGGSGGRGSDWNTIWDKNYKLWNMWHVYPNDGSSNIKSPISFAPIEAAMAEFNENDIGVTITPTNEEDKEKAKVLEHGLRYVESLGDFGNAYSTTFKDCLITGTAFAHTCWLSKKREVELFLNTRQLQRKIKKAEGKEKKNLQKVLDSGKPLTEKKEVIEYDDVAYIPMSVYEVWVDPDARCLHGKEHEATDLIWRNFMSLEQFKAEYINSLDPYMKTENFDKVVGARSAAADYEGVAKPFFEAPQDVDDDNQVEIVRYYNKATDKFIILANDILMRDGPLPYNHKEIPIVMHTLIRFPHQFYGIGFPDVLESLQSEDETLRNLMLDQLKININPPLVISSNIYNDVEEQADYPEAGRMWQISGDINQMKWFEGSQPRMDYAMMRNTLQEDAIKTSGVNPLAYSVPKPNEPVRNNLLSLESTLKMLKKGIKNYAYGLKDAVKQIIAIQQQYYTKDKIIRLEGWELQEEEGKLQEKAIETYSFFALKPKYFDLAGDVDIKIDIDTLVPMSQGLKMQKVEQAMQVLIPILSNPEMLKAPGISQLVREYVETHQLSERIIEQLKDESSPDEVIEAQKQEDLIEQGVKVKGYPGESDAHRNSHVSKFMEWKMKMDNLEDERKAQPMPPMPLIPGMDMSQLDMIPKESKQIANLRDQISSLAEHMMTDNEQKGTSTNAAIGMAQQLTAPPPMPPMPQGPAMGPPPPGMPPQGMLPQGMPTGMPAQGGIPGMVPPVAEMGGRGRIPQM